MKLTELKQRLLQLEYMGFKLPHGDLVPSHFHVTEVGSIRKRFVDCGGTLRQTETVQLQLWSASDYDHRLHPDKLLQIITLSERLLALPDADVEVAYQGETIQIFGLDFDGTHFLLNPLQTDCLAKEKCGVPAVKPKIKMSELQKTATRCTPNSGCC